MYTKAALAGLVLGASSALAKDSRTYGISYFWSSPLVEARMDPVITPGKVSSHVHTVVGGDAFSINMGQEDANNAKCTQSRVLGDKSNYWFPPPYHQNSDGTFTKVELDYVKAYCMLTPGLSFLYPAYVLQTSSKLRTTRSSLSLMASA